MIDWFALAVTFLWILGLGALLAALSYSYWLLSGGMHGSRRVLSSAFIRISLAVGLGLVGLGALLSVTAWWERIGWAGVVALAFLQGICASRSRRSEMGGD